MKKIVIENLPELPYYITEALNQLRISLSFSGQDVKSIMVTSSMPNEGKSFIAMQLWKMIAEVGNRVVILDCDLRNSEMRSKLGFELEEGMPGIIHGISGQAELEDVVYPTNIENGFLVPVEMTLSNPSNLLEGSRFSELLQMCREEFDYVIIDSPPVGAVADALTIGPLTDGCLYVIWSGKSQRKLVENSIQLLKRADIPLLGVVLNRADINRRRSYYYHQYYRYSYDYYGGKKRKR